MDLGSNDLELVFKCRGLYYVKVSASVITRDNFHVFIKTGQKLSLHEKYLTPIGCFAAPSTFDARIGANELECPFPIQNGHVEHDKSFRSRSVVVRYRDEVHVSYRCYFN